ncbi:unnamed protein product, partial [Laminaria digitata]
RILSWSNDGTARLWHVIGDLDFSKEHYILQAETVTGYSFDPLTLALSQLSSEDYREKRAAYLEIAKAHAQVCKYPSQNLYIRQYGVPSGE